MCMECSRRFVLKHSLVRHVKTVHLKIKPFGCVKCAYKSNRSDNVLFHLRKVHKVDRPTKSDVVIQQDLLEDADYKLKIDTVLDQAGVVGDDQQPTLATLIVTEIAA